MLYRKLGKTNLTVSILGFGCMRLPIQNGSSSASDRFDPNKAIDEAKAIELIHYAIEQGVNYFDTAYPYHHGKSETVVGKALKGYRDKVMLATKLPTWLAKTREDFGKFLEEQLKKLNTDYLDIYLVHGLDREKWNGAKSLGVLDFLDRIGKEGRVRYIGFSFHDDVRLFKEIVDSYDWMLCQIQYNYLDEDYQAGKEGLSYAASKGLGVVVMEPLRGGKLAVGIPKEVQAIWDSAGPKRSPAAWGLRWVWNHPEVSTVLSGMNALDQVRENIQLAADGKPRSLSEKELSIIAQVKETYRRMIKVDCTSCGYCMPCKEGVNIPQNFKLYNDIFLFRNAEPSVLFYDHFMTPEQRASNCLECRECEEHCPQGLKIADEMKEVHQVLSGQKTIGKEKG